MADDKRPIERLFNAFGLVPPKQPDGPDDGPGREANRKELENKPPEPDPRNQPTIQGPGMPPPVNHRVETPEQRKARLDRQEKTPPPPEPPSLDKAAERIGKIPIERPARRMLAPWEKDPRWGA